MVFIEYDTLKKFLKKNHKIVNRKKYIVLIYAGPYHLTIFKDQWNDDHMFHISDNNIENRCSVYYKINELGKIYELGSNEFEYNQQQFSSKSSTRTKCKINGYIEHILADFQIKLDRIMDG